jgi:aminopeptidase N
MFKFRFFSLVVISMMLILGFVATPLLADSGGIKVDDDSVCADVDRETNLLSNSATAYVWLNNPPAVYGATPVLPSEINNASGSNKKNAAVSSPTLYFTQCPFPDDSYFWAPFTTPGVSGVYTITVFDPAGVDVVGNDTWRQ